MNAADNLGKGQCMQVQHPQQDLICALDESIGNDGLTLVLCI